MRSSAEGQSAVVCARCGIAIELCAFCEHDECRGPLCYRCVRVAMAQEVRQPHVHGG